LPKAKRVALVVVSAAFTAIGIAAFVADSDERLTSALITIFFGSCLLVFLAPLFERAEARPRRAVVAHRGVRSEALVFPLAASRMRIFGIAGAAWAVVGALMLAYPESLADPGESTTFLRVVGGSLVVLFGGVAVLMLFRGGGFVALLPDGILARAGPNGSFVPWTAVESVEVVTMYDTPMVAVRTSDPAAVEVPRWARLFSRANRAMLGADVFYTNLAMPETELAAAIAERLEEPSAAR
jgi:hypothetical protein